MYVCLSMHPCVHIKVEWRDRFLCTRLYMCGPICMYRHWKIHVYGQYLCVCSCEASSSQRTFLMSPVCADIRPYFRKHVFHLYGLLSPGCFLSQIKKQWTYSSSLHPPHHLPSLGKAKPPHSCRTMTPNHPTLWLSQSSLPQSQLTFSVDANSFLLRAFLCLSRERRDFGGTAHAGSHYGTRDIWIQ